MLHVDFCSNLSVSPPTNVENIQKYTHNKKIYKYIFHGNHENFEYLIIYKYKCF